jgi:hypothetical protein
VAEKPAKGRKIKGKGKKGKGKEKAHHATNGGGDADSKSSFSCQKTDPKDSVILLI